MPERKKILYIITKSVWGGAQRYVYDLATNLPKDRFEPVVAAGGDGPLFDMLKNAGVGTITIPGLQRDVNFWKELVSACRLFRIIKNERPEVVHLSSSKAGGLGAVAAKIASIVTSNRLIVIFTVHGWGFHEDRPWLSRAAIFFLSWVASLFQDKIILIDRADFAAAKIFIPEHKLVFIPHGIAPTDYMSRNEARAFFAERIGRAITSDTILIGAIAELTKNKGLFHLIDAINQMECQMSNVKCQILIIGEGEGRTTLQRQIDSCGLRDSVFLLGFLPNAPRYLIGLDIFVLPSLKEGLPYAVMDAMAAGLPIVATGVGGIPDLITDRHEGLLAPPKDPARIAEALATLISNPAQRELFGMRAQEKIKTKFPLRAMLQRTTFLYDHRQATE